MRILFSLALGLACCLVEAAEDDSDSDLAEREAAFNKRIAQHRAICEELKATLPRDGGRATSARLELDYWVHWPLNPHQRTAVATIEGDAAEVVFLTVPSESMPGTDFSMALLLLDKHVVDWASCWTHNRTANQELLLEDVDGDGKSDVAFRASEGWHGLIDERQHGRSKDSKKWLYAYRVTNKGLRSIFPNKEREVKIDVSCDTAGQPVALQAKGIPESLRERQLVECTLSLTNQSDKELAIEPYKWFALDEKKNGAVRLMMYSKRDRRVALKPGETVSQAIRFFIESKDKEVKLCWRYVRKQDLEAPGGASRIGTRE